MTNAPVDGPAELTATGPVRSNWRALVALVAGIIAAVTTVFPVPYLPIASAIAALGFGIVGLQEGGPQHRGRWLAVGGVVLGSVCLLYIGYLFLSYTLAR